MLSEIQSALDLLGQARVLLMTREHGKAAELYLAAGDHCLEQENPLAAAAIFDECARALGLYAGHDRAKLLLSQRLTETRETLRGDRKLAPVERIPLLFQHAARFWSRTDQPFSGHRGACVHCGALKDTAWIRCTQCAGLPRTPTETAIGLLLSERVCTKPRVESLSKDFMRTGHQQLARSAAHYFAEALRSEGILQLPEPENLVPGRLSSALADDERRAVLFEVIAGSAEVTEKPAFVDFAAELGRQLLAGDDWRSQLETARRDLQRRFGARIEIGRIEQLGVGNGVTAVNQVNLASPARRGRRRTQTTLVVAGVAIEAAPSLARRTDATLQLADFARTLAGELLMMDCETPSPEDGPPVNVSELLLASRFDGDPSLSTAGACEVLSSVLGADVTVAGAARLLRHEYEPSHPGDFPGEQALRA